MKDKKKLEDALKELAKKMANPNPSITDLVKEGDAIIEKETTSKPKSSKKEKIPQNPYAVARVKILMKYPAWRRNEIAEMEKTGNINNRFYDAFVKDVMEEGDKRS